MLRKAGVAEKSTYKRVYDGDSYTMPRRPDNYSKHPGFLVKFQHDGAGAHQNRKYRKYLVELFLREGWFLTTQPPNSPLTNVLDLLIFPAMSKHVSHNKMQFNLSMLLI